MELLWYTKEYEICARTETLRKRIWQKRYVALSRFIAITNWDKEISPPIF